jgi:hypothetical protein
MTTAAIYEGTVTHHRMRPVEHRFTYRLFHVYLDPDHLDATFAGTRWWRVEQAAPASFRRRDHLPGGLPLAEQARTLVEAHTGERPAGPVRLLTHVRMSGVSFNPVSFFYCFDEGGMLAAIIAEITNIPWLERHCYVLDCRGRAGDELVFDLDKRFHISPFMPMRQHYRWRFTVPGESLGVHMESRDGEQPLFTATLAHRRRVLTPTALDALLWRYPLMPMQVVAGIYGQAARLWWKGVPVHDHPHSGPEVRKSGSPEVAPDQPPAQPLASASPALTSSSHRTPGLPDFRTSGLMQGSSHGP